jgi:hypothetical protein
MKVSFNSSLITNLIAKHIEKAVLALVCLLALFLVYEGIAESGGLDWEPSRLEMESASAETELDARDVKIVTDWEVKAKRLRAALDVSKGEVENFPYDHKKNWRPSPFGVNVKRDVPPLFTVEDLRATAGWGAVQMTSPDKVKLASKEPLPVRGDTEGQRWVVLTAAIPVAKQLEAYDEAFKDSYQDPIRDVPSYIYYRVQRAEVDPLGSATELQWTQLDVGYVVGGAFTTTQYWNARPSEIIAPSFLIPPIDIPMAFPLPPQPSPRWGPEIAHEPDIPFYYAATLTENAEDLLEGNILDDPNADEPGRMPLGVRPGRSRRTGTGAMGQRSSRANGMNEGEGGRMMGGMQGVYRGTRRGMHVGGGPMIVGLFRFFDFTVEPGKHYRYRVRLLLANPNKDVPPEHLALAELREVKYLETEFCDPTDVVTVPLDSRLLCVGVKSSAKEPSSHMMSVHFDSETGEESAAEWKKLYRGQLANFFKIPVETAPAAGGPASFAMMNNEDEGSGMSMMGMMAGGGREPPRPGNKGRRTGDRGRRPKRDKEPEEEVEMVDHLTQHIILDFDGGQRMDRELTRPCSVLLLDPSGQLVVRSDLNDLEEYLTYHVPEEEPGQELGEGVMPNALMRGRGEDR